MEDIVEMIVNVNGLFTHTQKKKLSFTLECVLNSNG